MKATSKFNQFSSGFKSSFWTANIMELFERLAYYGQAAVLSVYLKDILKFTPIEVGQLSSIFGGLIYFLPIFAGALADKFGFKKAFSIAFLLLSIGYALIGLPGFGMFGFLSNSALFWLMVGFLIFTAVGGSFIKPSVLGTIAHTTTSETKSLGYAIYYWLVNIGGALGPFIAFFVRSYFQINYVYIVSSLSCLAMLIITLTIYKNPIETAKQQKSIKTLFSNMGQVLLNTKFMIFLLIFSLFWLLFWQIYVIIPLYVTDYIDKDAAFDLIISTGAWAIIIFQLPVNLLTKRFSTNFAIVLGFFISALCWGIIYFNPSIPFIVAGLAVSAIGEMTQAPRYYEYIADIAPEGQTAMYQGFAFLPIAIGWILGGNLGGYLYDFYAKSGTNNPSIIFLILFIIGLFSTISMYLYNRIIVKQNKA